jgi:hypothetical protein
LLKNNNNNFVDLKDLAGKKYNFVESSVSILKPNSVI